MPGTRTDVLAIVPRQQAGGCIHSRSGYHDARSIRCENCGQTLRRGPAMTTATRFLRRDPADVRPWVETCGQIRCLIEEKDGAAGEVHHVEIHDAKLHYHER